MINKHKKEDRIRNMIINHVNNNLKEYFVVTIIFIIGIIFGVIFVNNATENQSQQIGEYINNFMTTLKNNGQINQIELLKNSIKENVVLALIFWIAGSTVIGIIVVYILIAFRGFCLGYAIASIMVTLEMPSNIFFVLTSILLQNIILIPCVLGLGVSGIKLYSSIMKDKRKENIKIEIYRHAIFSFCITIVLIFSSFVETYISTNLLHIFIKYM